MTGQLEISREDHLGIIALNRPEAINALNAEMIGGITRTLERWRDDDGIRAVLFEGRGARGFCAGGDVRAVRQMVLDGRPEQADAYFAAEYFMNGLIATFPKPTMALTHGVVMGGGIGIAGHCRYRFTTPDSKWAMPEAAIGFVADVGSNFILAKAPRNRALAFLMSGVPAGPADAIALGLCDCVVDPQRLLDLKAGIARAATAERVYDALVMLVQAEMAPAGEPLLCQAADRHAAIDWNDGMAIVAALSTEPLLARIATRSPTSLAAVLVAQDRARDYFFGLDAILQMELRLACHLARQPDFAEGVRATLVDKDHLPRWQPDTLGAVDWFALESVSDI
jgi:enoyl-CoA hydratase